MAVENIEWENRHIFELMSSIYLTSHIVIISFETVEEKNQIQIGRELLTY